MFPEELPKRLILMYSFVGDTILDPFLGSGTTTKVAADLGRNSIGFELGFNREKWKGIVKNKIDIAILDTSAAAHMPDVLEMPYRPDIINAKGTDILPYNYRLAGLTCLAGDIIGDYSFKKPLKIGDRVIFCDMAHYTMVKNNTFNGVQLPSIILYDSKTGKLNHVKKFDYSDYRNRLS